MHPHSRSLGLFLLKLKLLEVCWWHMKDGAVLGVHHGMIIEYDAGHSATST